MKKIIALVLVLMLVLGAIAMAETVTLGTNVAFPPYEFYDDETGEPTGIDIEIAKVICEKLGYELEIVDMDFASVIPALVSNKIERANDLLRHPKDDLAPVSLSVGVAFSDRKNTQGDIFSDADAAAYRVKRAGGGGCAFFE